MNELLQALYDNFHEPYMDKALDAEVDACHKELIRVLDKPERKLVLHIIDTQDLLSEQKSIHSFISGFKLAWRLWNEVNGATTPHLNRRAFQEKRPRDLSI